MYSRNRVGNQETPYGKGISIQDTEGLHRAIGQWIITTPKPINGLEVRFLRLEMDLTQRRLAALMGATEQTLRLWEKQRAKAIQGPADRMLRLRYGEYTGGDSSVKRMVERLAELDQVEHPTACLLETEDGWRVDFAQAA